MKKKESRGTSIKRQVKEMSKDLNFTNQDLKEEELEGLIREKANQVER